VYATVRRYEMGAGSRGAGAVKELMRRCEANLVPEIGGLDGFGAFYVVDAGNGIIATIGVFDGAAAAEEGNKVAARYFKEQLSGLLQANPQVTSGEALVHSP
jgi:hypothetical protein